MSKRGRIGPLCLLCWYTINYCWWNVVQKIPLCITFLLKMMGRKMLCMPWNRRNLRNKWNGEISYYLRCKNIISHCENCPGESQNRRIAAMVYKVVNLPTEVFLMCFLEKGHNRNLADETKSLREKKRMFVMRQIRTKYIIINRKIFDRLKSF